MRILVVTQYFWPENFRINDLVLELVKRKYEVTVLTGKPNYPSGKVFEDYRVNPKKYEQYESVKIFRAPMLARGQGAIRLFMNYLSFVVGASLWGGWQLRRFSYDIIFVFEPSPVTVGLPAILLGRLKRAPVVFWALDLWPETLAAIDIVRSTYLLGLIGRLVKFIYSRCTFVLGQSRGFLSSIAKYCVDSNKILYFPSWAEEIFGAGNITRAAEIPESEGVFTILFAGNIGEAQDLPAVLMAAESLKMNQSIRWVFVGDGRKYEWFQQEVSRRNLQDSILLLGRFPIERMPSFYAHADALLVSLKKDPVFSMTIPGKVQSYLMSAIPVLGMLDGEGADVIKLANAGYTCPAGDSVGLAAVVLKMANLNVEQRHALGLNGRKYAETEFGRKMLMDRLENIFDEAVLACNNTAMTK